MDEKTESGLALFFTTPIATVSLIIATAFGGIIGSAVWMLGKVWQIGFPAFWRIKIEKKKFQNPRVLKGESKRELFSALP